tara:strand:- start:81 stop:266 length:186 start_codon:yes stop_codon:yes gene_type:complete
MNDIKLETMLEKLYIEQGVEFYEDTDKSVVQQIYDFYYKDPITLDDQILLEQRLLGQPDNY